MTKCPVCGRKLVSKFTQLKTGKQAVMVTCEYDSRHMRAFFNDPQWCDKAREAKDPLALIAAAQ